MTDDELRARLEGLEALNAHLEAENTRLRDGLRKILGGHWAARNSVETIVWIADRVLKGDHLKA